MYITPKMDEVITRVAKHLAQQKERAIGGNGCMYRTPGGKMCAVGCLIPDELYSESFDAGLSTSVTSILISSDPAAALVADHLMNLCGLLLSEEVATFYRAMQRYHDLSSPLHASEHVAGRTPRMFIPDLKAYSGPDEDLWKYLADSIREVVEAQ